MTMSITEALRVQLDTDKWELEELKVENAKLREQHSDHAANLETALECERLRQERDLLVIEKGPLKTEYEQLLADRQEEQLEIESLQRTLREKESCVGELRERCGALEQKLSERELTSELETYRLISKEQAKWETREAGLEQQLTRLQRDLDHSRREQESRLSLISYGSEEGEGGSNHEPAPGSMEETSQGVGTEASMMVSKVVSTCSDSKTPDMVQVVNSWKSPLVGGSSGLWLPISSCTNSADGVPPVVVSAEQSRLSSVAVGQPGSKSVSVVVNSSTCGRGLSGQVVQTASNGFGCGTGVTSHNARVLMTPCVGIGSNVNSGVLGTVNSPAAASAGNSSMVSCVSNLSSVVSGQSAIVNPILGTGPTYNVAGNYGMVQENNASVSTVVVNPARANSTKQADMNAAHPSLPRDTQSNSEVAAVMTKALLAQQMPPLPKFDG